MIAISLKFVLKDLINNILALVQIMACRRPGNKPLFEPMIVRLPMNIYFTRPQGVNRWGHFFQNVNLVCGAVHCKGNAFVWNWFNTIDAWSVLWVLMASCFSTRASVATVLITDPWRSRYLWVDSEPLYMEVRVFNTQVLVILNLKYIFHMLLSIDRIILTMN